MTRRALPLFLFALAAVSLHGQSIFTYAGGGTLDGQLLKDIVVSGPSGIAVDSAGNLYVTLTSAGQVVKVDATTSRITTVAGVGSSGYSGDGGLAIHASLRQPHGIALDPAGNLYIADSDNNRVRRVDAKSGIITTFAGGVDLETGIGDNGLATAANLGRPWAIVIDHGAMFIGETAYNAHRVRRVDMTTNIITTYAGKAEPYLGGFSGDNGPAKNAELNNPYGLSVDQAGNLYINDAGNKRIRRVDTNGTITTYAGGGPEGNFADGIPATSADLVYSFVSTVDRDGNLLVATTEPGVRRIDKNTHTITTLFKEGSFILGMAVDASNRVVYTNTYQVARFTPGAADPVYLTGNGTYVGDGLRADAAVLHSPQGLALDRDGNLYIVDLWASIIRKVSAADRTISTVAGMIGRAYADPDQGGIKATEAAIGFPTDIAFDAANNLYIADELNQRIWRVDTNGIITSYAGGGQPADGIGDNDLATKANFIPWGITFDSAGNLYIADNDFYATPQHARIRKIDAQTKKITTVAGSAEAGFDGDGDLATKAKLNRPISVVFDNDGNYYIADSNNYAIRRVDHVTGKISTIAGHNDGAFADNIPATQATIEPLHLFFNRTTRELLFPDHSSHRIRKIDQNNIISTVAGSAMFYWDGGYGGDNGPATAARLSFDYGDVSGIALTPNGDLFFSDSQNNRVRVVYACASVAAPSLAAPSNGATNVSTAPRLTWSAVSGAFRYDVILDTNPNPTTIIATDVDEPSLTLANLQPNTKYYWKVISKGDRYCPSASNAASAIASFTTANVCGAGAFALTAPNDGATGLVSPVHLTWQASSGATNYDVYLGATNPPPLVAANVKATSYDATISGTAYWFVVAHADCDATKTAVTAIRSFTTSGGLSCTPLPSVTLTSPAANATNVSTTVDLQWSATGTADSYAVYFGTTNPPPLLQDGLSSASRSLALSALATGTTYYWRVGINSACFTAQQLSPVQSFKTVVDCRTPGAATILFAPKNASAGSTYAIVWSPASGIGTDGGYLVERSLSQSFSSLLDTQVTSSTAASFLANTTGTVYHRVKALAGCNPDVPGPASDIAAVTIAEAPANVIFTVAPQALVTGLGERIEDHLGTFTLENIGATALQVIVGRQELGGSPPFFSIAEDAAFVTLAPRTPRTFTIRYSGPPNNVAGSYQGVIFVAATGQGGLAVTPYAFVNLKVGGVPSSKPEFLVDGSPSDYAAFEGFSGDDANRPPRKVSIRNSGSAPMELAAEIAPEVWLSPGTGWNATALAPGATRTIDLFTQRSRAPNGSPLPRYTYFTVRTKDGATAKLLVQDNDQLAVSQGRATSLDASTRSFIVPEVVSKTSSRGNRLVTRMRLTNVGGDAVQAEVIYTPAGSDGFDASRVKRTIVVVPANDVVTVTDPIVQLYGLQAPATGTIEVRLPRERVGLVAVRASIVNLAGGGGFETPVVARGDGARVGAPHAIYLLPSSNVSLTLTETSGNDGASVRVLILDDNGNTTSTMTQQLARYGTLRLDNLTASRIQINADSGGGSVIGIATIAGNFGESGATLVSRLLSENVANSAVASRLVPNATALASVTTVVPVVRPTGTTTKVSVGFVGLPGNTTEFLMTFRGSGSPISQKLTLNPGASRVFSDLVADFFNQPGAQGSVFIDAPSGTKVYAVMGSGATVNTTPTSSMTLPTTLSEALTGFASSAQRVLSFDGLEQSTDATRGDRWLLALNEVAGGGGTVNVRLYEAANRTSPIAQKDFTIAAYQQLTLDSIFSQLGLDAADRRKDRTNVQVVVSATSGKARVAASAIAVNVQSSETRVFALTPAVGSGTPNVQFAAPVITEEPTVPPKRRAARH